MIRKQVYIEARHERMLKRRARQRGVTESQIIREALEGVETVAVVRRREVDGAVGRQALTDTMVVTERRSDSPVRPVLAPQ
jgi:hypothetical protein